MKTIRILILAAVLGTSVCIGADSPLAPAIDPATGLPIVEPEKRFDLDFKGGFPQNLVEAIEKAAKTPINVIIPNDHKDFFLPPLKMRYVTVPQLFEALTMSSVRTDTRPTTFGQQGSPNHYQQVTTKFGFKTSSQLPRANSIWYFFVDLPPSPPPQATAAAPKPYCRFWQLEPYLEKLKIEDITTAIETGWKMLGVNPLPKLSFHKDTKLLIVVGPQEQLALIDDVLRQLTELTGPGRQGLIPNRPGQIPGLQIPRN